MAEKTRYCTVQVDLDGLWVIERLLGRDIPVDPDPVFEMGLKRLLVLLDEFSIKATFFVVGRDLTSARKAALVRDLASAGHEIASHGQDHAYLSRLEGDAIRRELFESKRAIEESCQTTASGFKAPGFAARRDLTRYLEDAGYRYDSSVLPTPFGWVMQALARIPYPLRAMAFAPSMPYRPAMDDLYSRGPSRLVELPVTTVPFARLPAHFSYSLAGGGAYYTLVRRSFAAMACPAVTYLFHPLDLVDAAEMPATCRVNGASLAIERKMAMAREMLRILSSRYTMLRSYELADTVRKDLHAAS